MSDKVRKTGMVRGLFVSLTVSYYRRQACPGNQLERRFRRTVAELEAEIASFIDPHNEDPRPCRWVKSADQILGSAKRFFERTRQTLWGGL